MLRKGIRMILITALLCAALTGCSGASFYPNEGSEESAPQEIPLAYTEEYVLFSGGTDADGYPLVGLLDRDHREILPAVYREIGVAENGIVFARSEKNGVETYRIFTAEGEQIGGDYAHISCAVPPQEDDDWLYREATFAEMPPVPPYIAHTEDDNGKCSFWLLDENGLPIEAEPYDDIDLYDDGSVAKCRDGILYQQAADGTVTRFGDEVVQTFFDGKYYIKNYFPGVHAALFSLWDRSGRQIAPPKYSTIQVPFEDRYVLYKGSRQFLGGEQAFLYDDTGRLLASNSNYFSFYIQPDGSYIGVSYVGNPYDGYVDMQILDEAGNPEPQGVYFIDKNGARLSERYQYLELYENNAQFQEVAALQDVSLILSKIGGPEQMADITEADGLLPEEAFFLVLTTEGSAFKLPLKSVLLGGDST